MSVKKDRTAKRDKKGSYVVMYQCLNCFHRVFIQFRKGKEAPTYLDDAKCGECLVLGQLKKG